MTFPFGSGGPSYAPFRIVRATNDVLFGEDGREYIDLLSGSGAVFLGHAHPEIAASVKNQLDMLWNTGVVQTPAHAEAREAIDAFCGPSHHLAILYSTGMEAAEFALRVARNITGKPGVIGFDGSMHGKSMATAGLAWPNDLVALPDVHRLPYLPASGEADVLESVQRVLRDHPISAVFLEPLLGSSGGHVPSPGFAQQLASVCSDRGALLVIDEILTGFHRTGPAFLYRELGVEPDIILIGKAMGNGFPVSGVVVDPVHRIDARMLPGSTFSGNPLASAATVATLRAMAQMELPQKVAEIERTMLSGLQGLEALGIKLRGKGAIWILELPPFMTGSDLTAEILRGGVVVSPTRQFVRLLPAATITLAHLREACDVIRTACEKLLQASD